MYSYFVSMKVLMFFYLRNIMYVAHHTPRCRLGIIVQLYYTSMKPMKNYFLLVTFTQQVVHNLAYRNTEVVDPQKVVGSLIASKVFRFVEFLFGSIVTIWPQKRGPKQHSSGRGLVPIRTQRDKPTTLRTVLCILQD